MSATLTPCGYPLCGGVAVYRGYCRRHAPPLARGEQRRERSYSPRTRNNNRLFLRMRRAFLMRHPVCNACGRDSATVLDHVIPHRGNVDLFWDPHNWQGLCVSCHGRKSARGE